MSGIKNGTTLCPGISSGCCSDCLCGLVLSPPRNAKEGSKTYNSVTETFLDAYYAAEQSMDPYTYQNWGDLDNSRRIDYFMLWQSGFAVHEYMVLTHTHDGVYAGDHCPIVMTLTME